MDTGIELIRKAKAEQSENHQWEGGRAESYSNGQLVDAAEYCMELSKYKLPKESKWPWSTYLEDKIRHKKAFEKMAIAGAFYLLENERTGTHDYDAVVRKIVKEIDAWLKKHKQPEPLDHHTEFDFSPEAPKLIIQKPNNLKHGKYEFIDFESTRDCINFLLDNKMLTKERGGELFVKLSRRIDVHLKFKNKL